MNISYSENLSTTTIIDAISSTSRNRPMRPMETEAHNHSRTGRGCNERTSFFAQSCQVYRLDNLLHRFVCHPPILSQD